MLLTNAMNTSCMAVAAISLSTSAGLPLPLITTAMSPQERSHDWTPCFSILGGTRQPLLLWMYTCPGGAVASTLNITTEDSWRSCQQRLAGSTLTAYNADGSAAGGTYQFPALSQSPAVLQMPQPLGTKRARLLACSVDTCHI